MSAETFEQVTRDFAVSFAEPQPDQPTDLVLEQWTAGVNEPPDMATLNRIYVAPKQVPRVAIAMLHALRVLPAAAVFAATGKGLQDALEQRKADGRAGYNFRPGVVRRMAALLRERRQAEAAKAAEAAAAPAPKAAKGKRKRSRK